MDMLKDNMLQILDLNKEIIKNAFDVDEDGIVGIRKLLEKDRENFKQVVNEIFLSDASNREKMVAYYLIGYVNGARTKKMKSKD